MADVNIGERVASTYERTFGDKPTDNIFTSQALWMALGEKGFKKSAKGGRLFEADIEYATNTTMQFVGEFDMLDVTRINTFDAARYDVKTCAGTISYSYQEMLMNQGSDMAKFDLIAARIENGRMSHSGVLNSQSWSTAPAGSLEIIPLPTIISATPTTGTVGGINAATYVFWRNRQNSGAKTTTLFDNLVSAMTTTFDQCSLGGIKKTPTAAISDLTTFAGYESVMQARLRYMVDDLKRKGDTAFSNSAIMFKDIPYFYDEDHPSARVDFLNNDVLKFEYLEGSFMKLEKSVQPSNQLVNTHIIHTMGNWVCAARRHLGCVTLTTS